MLNNKHVVLRIDVGSVKRETPTVVHDMIAANMVGSRDSGRNVMQGYIQNSVSESILSEPQIFSEDFLQNGKQPFVVTTLNTIFGKKRVLERKSRNLHTGSSRGKDTIYKRTFQYF